MNNEELAAFLQQHVKSGTVRTYSDGSESRLPAKRIVCASGFVFSVQASEMHYCIPRKNNPGASGYTAFEVGFPSATIDAMMPYAENPDAPTETVYGYVPLGIIVDVIQAQGGLDKEKY
jgi:hypothetical protein